MSTKKVYINYCTATHALSYYDDISKYSLSVYKNKTRQTFANLPVTLVINISLPLVAKSSVIDDECSLQHGQQLHDELKPGRSLSL